MDNDTQKADDIRRKMHAFRSKLRGDVQGVVANAKQLADWRHYYRNFTWATLGLAASLGYLVVPRRPKMVPADAATLQELAENQRLVVKPRRAGLISSLFSSVAPLLVRAGIDRIGRQMALGTKEHAHEDRLARETHP